jgi:xanthine dehydrogenase YagT iron-sulfur-binding subunit
MDQPKPHARDSGQQTGCSRRHFLQQSSAILAFVSTPSLITKAASNDERIAELFEKVSLSVEVNGLSHQMSVEPRLTLLDLLREQLELTGTKKGCDYGQCGACTVHMNGDRILSCLTLALKTQGKKITTIEGIATGDKLHPLQQAFIKHDGLQCGYCTPGQIMSGIACIREGHATSRQDIQEYMSGNICRCGAYPNITSAIEEVQKTGGGL